MLIHLLLVGRGISDRKEFDGRIASEGQNKITLTHTHRHQMKAFNIETDPLLCHTLT